MEGGGGRVSLPRGPLLLNGGMVSRKYSVVISTTVLLY
jgi:hypothetical protein